MKVVELEREHLYKIKLRNFELEDLSNGEDIGTNIDFYLNSQYKKAILQDDRVIVAMGGHIENRQCHTWLIASEEMYECPITTMKLVKRLHKESVEKHNVNLFWTYNLPNFEREVKFVESIGYSRAGEIDSFDDGLKRILLIMEV